MVILRKLGLSAVAALVLGTTGQANEYQGYEIPPYNVVATYGEIEVRQYEQHLMAKVWVSGDQRGAINRGFRVLAGYIFGGNATGEKIAMTAPVAQTQDGGNWEVSFMVPSKYAMSDLPKADSNAIRFEEIKGGRQVVLHFSGRAGTQRLQDKTQELRNLAAAQGLSITGDPHYYFYDGPFTLPRNRRNEVAFSLR